MSENPDKSNINESNDSEQSLDGAVEHSDEALQKNITVDSPSPQRVQRPHCKYI